MRADPTLLSYGLDNNNTEWATEDQENHDQDRRYEPETIDDGETRWEVRR